MEHAELLNRLKTDLKPVHRLPSPVKRFFAWLLASGICLAAGLAYYGFRRDLSSVLANPVYLLEGIILLGATLSAAFSAFLLSVPGWERGKVTRYSALLPPILWLIILGLRALSAPKGFDPGLGFTCIRDIVTIGLLPGVLLFLMIRQAAPQKLEWSGALGLLAVAAIGAFATHLSCSNDSPSHIFVWHFLPVLGLGWLGVRLGRKFLARDR